MKGIKRGLATLLALLLLVTLLPTFVLADETKPTDVDEYPITPFSLLPLKEVELTANIVLASESEKSAVYMYDFLSSLEGSGENYFNWPSVILWNNNIGNLKDPSFQIVEYDDTVDLSSVSNGDKLMFIGGNSASQFDKNNVRYIVTVNFESLPMYADIILYLGKASEDVNIDGGRVYLNGQTTTLLLPPNSELDADYHLSLYGVPTSTDNYTAKLYKGNFNKESDIPSDLTADVTSAIFSADGLPIKFVEGESQHYTFVFRGTQNEVLGIKGFSVKATVDDVTYPSYAYLYLFAEENGVKGKSIDYDYVWIYGETNSANFSIPADYSLGNNYYLTISSSYINNNDKYYKATVYKGEYTAATLGTAPVTDNITTEILGQSGWKTNFGTGTESQTLTFVFQNRADDSILSITAVTITAQSETIYIPSYVFCGINAEAGSYYSTSYAYFGDTIAKDFDARKLLTEDYYLWFSPYNLTSGNYTVKVYEGKYTEVSELASATEITDSVFTQDAYKINFGGEDIEKSFTFLFDKVDGTKEVNNITFMAHYNTVSTPYSVSLRLYKEGVQINLASSYSLGSYATLSIPQNYTLSDTYNLQVGSALASETNLYTVDIYKGNFTTEADIPTSPDDKVTTALLNEGYSVSFAGGATHSFTFVFKRKLDGKFISARPLTVGATAASVYTPYDTFAVLSVIKEGTSIEVDSNWLYIGSSWNRFYISQKYSLGETYNLKLPDFELETDIYTTEIYLGSFTTKDDIPAETEKNITTALLGDGYNVESFADGKTTSFTFVFRRKLDGQFLFARPTTIGVEHKDVVFPSSADFELYALSKDKNGTVKDDVYEVIDVRNSSLSESATPTVFFLVQPKTPSQSIKNDIFGISAVSFDDEDLATEVYRGIFNDLDSLTDESKITNEFYGKYGYMTDFKNEINEREFTFVCTNKYDTEEVKIFSVILSAAYYTDNLSDYQTVDFKGAKDVDTYKVRREDDTYWQFGYQTFFVANGTDLSNIVPIFETDEKVGVYAYGQKQESEKSSQNFSNGSVLYTAIAEDTRTAANYQVKFIGQERGAKLFVNGPPETREIYFDSVYGKMYHDILIANIGDQELTNISVSLENAENITLDSYWNTVGYSNSLSAFTSVETKTEYGQLANIAKIRLLPDDASDGGAISGTLRITATDAYGSNMQVVRINLIGYAGKPALRTDSIKDAVKYVPYSFLLQTDNIHNDKTKPMYNKPTFKAVGSLPSGLELFESGEIYGVPKVSGLFQIKIRIEYSYEDFEDEEYEFDLTVLENTDIYVNAASDYIITNPVPNLTSYQDWEIEIPNDYSDFMDLFYLDGKELKPNVDYTSKEGSTKITIHSQTFQNAGNGTHTIAAEFRLEGDETKTMTKAAQNYTATVSTTQGQTVKETPITTEEETIEPPETPLGVPFTDVFTRDWYADAVKFVYENDLFEGTSETTFDPQLTMSRAMMVMVLYRLGGGEPVDENVFSDIDKSAWDANAVNWAAVNGIVKGVGNNLFAPNADTTREEMAVILYNYCVYKEITLPEVSDNKITDAQDVSGWALDAVVAMYKAGILQGKGNGVYDPKSNATRAEVATMFMNFVKALEI